MSKVNSQYKIQVLIKSNSKTVPLVVKQWPLILSVDWSEDSSDLRDYTKPVRMMLVDNSPWLQNKAQ